MNKSDSERIATVLENKGYQPALKIDEADLIIVNMCSVRQSAVDRVFGLTQKLKNLKTKKQGLKTILTGCILKEDKKKFAKNFDLILGIKDLLNWPQLFKAPKTYHLKPETYLRIQPKYSNNFSAFIPISNGCNWGCAYCVIPFTRGPLLCRDHREILEEVKSVIKSGFKEIWLLGQNVNEYVSRINTNMNSREINFARLLKMINEIPGDFWIRFTSPNPANFSDELIETMAKCEKVTPYLNLPVQSGDDEVLKKMNRPYTAEQYKNLVKKIRIAFKKYRKAPRQNKFGTGYRLEREIAISTDIIVGFPGESEKQFQNTVKLFKEIKFDMAYIAKYSPRPGTAAARLKDDVSPREKEKRYKILTEILKKTALEKNKKYIGKEVEVLVEKAKNKFLIGKTRAYKTVKINLEPKTSGTRRAGVKPKLVGQFAKVKILNALPWGLNSKLI